MKALLHKFDQHSFFPFEKFSLKCHQREYTSDLTYRLHQFIK
jgi:hypothetical protein